jgi:sigma-B regulation protein RsbU (phosphoserine phosphatase)
VQSSNPSPPAPSTGAPASATANHASDQQLLATLFDLGRQVTSVLDLDELLRKIPELIARLIAFRAFAVYLVAERSGELRIAYSVGYPDDVIRTLRLAPGQALVGAAVADGQPLLVNDVQGDPRYVEAVPGTRAELVVPLRRKGRVIGALNCLSEKPGQFTENDVAVLRQFGTHISVAIENARLFERQREYAATLETLAEIGREVSSILDLDDLLTRLAQLTKRIVGYRTFGILLLDPVTLTLEMKLAVKYGEVENLPPVRLGEGIVGYAALHKEPVLSPDVREDSRYIEAVADVRSELAIPLLVKDRCIGVFDLESPELGAFDNDDMEVLTLLASQAAVAIENARLYETIRANEERLEKELRFAQRVQTAFLPTEVPRRLKGVDLAVRFAPAHELGGDLYDFLCPEPHSLVVAVGDVSGKGVPAALYGAFAGELVRSRTFRRRYSTERSSPASILSWINVILHERQLEEYYCTLCYAWFDLKHRTVVLANSGLPYPIRCTEAGCAPVEISGVPLGTFAGSSYDHVTFDARPGDSLIFCTDGVFEAMDAEGHEFGTERLMRTIAKAQRGSARDMVNAIFDEVAQFRGSTPVNDDMTAVAIRITA